MGRKLRIYPKHIQECQSFLDTLPEMVKKEIKKASVCKRLINPDGKGRHKVRRTRSDSGQSD